MGKLQYDNSPPLDGNLEYVIAGTIVIQTSQSRAKDMNCASIWIRCSELWSSDFWKAQAKFRIKDTLLRQTEPWKASNMLYWYLWKGCARQWDCLSFGVDYQFRYIRLFFQWYRDPNRVQIVSIGSPKSTNWRRTCRTDSYLADYCVYWNDQYSIVEQVNS